MRNLFYLVVMALVFTSCGTVTKESPDKDSLAKTNRTVIYEVDLKVDAEMPNWMGNTDTKKLIKGIFDQVEKGERIAYQAMYSPDEEGSIMTWDDISNVFGFSDTIVIMDAETEEWVKQIVPASVDLREITKIIFIEEWSTDEDGKIIKEVLGVAPVRTYMREYDDQTIEEKKRIVFVTYFGDLKPWIFE